MCRSDHYSGQSSDTKESCSSTPLNRCTSTETRWNKKAVSLVAGVMTDFLGNHDLEEVYKLEKSTKSWVCLVSRYIREGFEKKIEKLTNRYRTILSPLSLTPASSHGIGQHWSAATTSRFSGRENRSLIIIIIIIIINSNNIIIIAY